mgnify:CR=1 FL=1
MDINKLKDRLNQLQTTTSTKNSFWKPEPGKTQIRIVPYKFNKDNPFSELFFHYQFENKTHISPVSFGRPDPINEFATKLKSSGDKDNWIQGKRLEPKMRTYVPIIVRGQENEGVKFWGFGKTVYQELLSIIADPDYGDITDPINGRDITVEKQTPAEAGNQYGKTTIRVKPNMTPLTENKNQLKDLFESQVELNTLWEEPSYDNLKQVLNNFLNPETEESEEETNSEPVAATTSNVGDAFDDLFNN